MESFSDAQRQKLLKKEIVSELIVAPRELDENKHFNVYARTSKEAFTTAVLALKSLARRKSTAIHFDGPLDLLEEVLRSKDMELSSEEDVNGERAIFKRRMGQRLPTGLFYRSYTPASSLWIQSAYASIVLHAESYDTNCAIGEQSILVTDTDWQDKAVRLVPSLVEHLTVPLVPKNRLRLHAPDVSVGLLASLSALVRYSRGTNKVRQNVLLETRAGLDFALHHLKILHPDLSVTKQDDKIEIIGAGGDVVLLSLILDWDLSEVYPNEALAMIIRGDPAIEEERQFRQSNCQLLLCLLDTDERRGGVRPADLNHQLKKLLLAMDMTPVPGRSDHWQAIHVYASTRDEVLSLILNALALRQLEFDHGIASVVSRFELPETITWTSHSPFTLTGQTIVNQTNDTVVLAYAKVNWDDVSARDSVCGKTAYFVGISLSTDEYTAITRARTAAPRWVFVYNWHYAISESSITLGEKYYYSPNTNTNTHTPTIPSSLNPTRNNSQSSSSSSSLAPLAPVPENKTKQKQEKDAETDQARLLDCIICQEAIPMPWTSCGACGCLLCSSCFASIQGTPRRCPQCRAKLKELARNLLAEQLVHRFKFPIDVLCGHDGCDQKVSVEMLSSHRAVCSHRPYKCPQGGCTYTGALGAAMFKHLTQNHEFHRSDGTADSLRQYISTWIEWKTSSLKAHQYISLPGSLDEQVLMLDWDGRAVPGSLLFVMTLCAPPGTRAYVSVSGGVDGRFDGTFRFLVKSYVDCHSEADVPHFIVNGMSKASLPLWKLSIQIEEHETKKRSVGDESTPVGEVVEKKDEPAAKKARLDKD